MPIVTDIAPWGGLEARQAAVTPGRARVRVSISSKISETRAPEWPLADGSTRSAITLSASNPRSTRRQCPQGPGQQARSEDHHQAHRDLDHDEGPGQYPAPGSACRRFPLHECEEFRACRLPRRRHPAENRRCKGQERGESEHMVVGGHVQCGCSAATRVQNSHEGVADPERQREPAESADDRQHGSLHQQLACEPCPRRPERQAYAELAGARLRPGQQQVGQVGARHQQHQAGHTHQDQHGSTEFRPHGVEPLCAVSQPELATPAGVDFLQGQTRLPFRLGPADAVSEASHRNQPGNGVHPFHARRAAEGGHEVSDSRRRHRDVETAVELGAVEAARRHADDAVVVPVQQHGSPDHAGVAAERAPPEPAAENTHRIGDCVAHVLVVQQAADGRGYAERAVVMARHQLAIHPPGAVAGRQADRPREPAEDPGERRRPFVEGVDGPQRPHDTRPFTAIRVPESDEAVRLGDRQPLYQDGVREREDRRVRADAEDQRGDRDAREQRTSPQSADGVADVLPELVGEPHAAPVPVVLHDLAMLPTICLWRNAVTVPSWFGPAGILPKRSRARRTASRLGTPARIKSSAGASR